MILLFDPSDNAIIPFDWSDVLTDTVLLTSVTHSVDSPLVKGAESNTATTSTVKVSGAIHGGRYMVSAQALLNNGEIINRQFPILGWNS